MSVDASYLRERAQHCVALARGCPHMPTSHALEALGIELMEKAAELEKSTALDQSAPPTSLRTPNSQ
jgi:hypothetical protein